MTSKETHTKERKNQGAENATPRSAAQSLFSVWEGMFKLAAGSVAAMANAQRASMEAAMHSLELMTSSTARLWGGSPKDVLPADKRFRDEAWR